MLDNFLGGEIFPNILSKPPLLQLKAISLCSTACYLEEETDTHLTTTSRHVVLEGEEVSIQLPFVQAKQCQFPQPILLRLVF